MTSETIGSLHFRFCTYFNASTTGEFFSDGVPETRSHLGDGVPSLIFGMIHGRIDTITIIRTKRGLRHKTGPASWKGTYHPLKLPGGTKE
jgi:hypothetical protein